VYTSFYGLEENPFNLTPDPRYLFLSPSHKEALDHLLYGINERKGFIVITGGVGTGKTTLCRALLERLDSSSRSALVFNTHISDLELLQTINREFGLAEKDPGEKNKTAYIIELNNFLLDNFKKGGTSVLLIDEAQNLSHSALEQVRMLSNLETEKEKLIQIVLAGQTELKELLTAPSLRQLNERILVRYDLKPLDRKDLKGYVDHRFVVAGGRGDVAFSDGALKVIFTYSRGNPRRINAVCDRALLIGYARGQHRITKDVAAKAVEDIQGHTKEQRKAFWFWNPIRLPLFVIVVLLALAALAMLRYQDRLVTLLSGQRKQNTVMAIEPPLQLNKGQTLEVPLLVDNDASLSMLFDLYEETWKKEFPDRESPPVGVMSSQLDPEFRRMFRKPFRVLSPTAQSQSYQSPRFLLVTRVTKNGALILDRNGKEQHIHRDVLLHHWGKEVSWVCPFMSKGESLKKGMRSPEVLEMQKMLARIGYEVSPTGVFDESTRHEVKVFQMVFGVQADGIAGPLTRALLYQMAG
jgi:general secretion pathway protein A